MPRRAMTVERDIPLYLVGHIVHREVIACGEELERVIVRKTGSHFYNVSVRTKPVRRELKEKTPAEAGGDKCGETVAGGAA